MTKISGNAVKMTNFDCSYYLKVQLRRVPTVSIEEVPELLLAEECKPSQVNNDDFDFEEEKLSEAFRTLPLMRQRILELLFVEQLSPQEIATCLNCSVQYVYNQRSLAIKALRSLITKLR